MTPERMFQELLGLGLNWEVVESRFDHKTSTVLLEIRETARLWESERCPEELFSVLQSAFSWKLFTGSSCGFVHERQHPGAVLCLIAGVELCIVGLLVGDDSKDDLEQSLTQAP
jgi:hypothetical protein